MSALQIVLSGEPLIAGGQAEGRLRLGPEARAPGLTLTLRFQYRTEGRGDPDEGESPAYPILRDASAPPAEIPFAVGLPHAPFTYAGKLIKIHWILRVSAVIAGFAQHFDEPIVLLSPFPSRLQRGYRS